MHLLADMLACVIFSFPSPDMSLFPVHEQVVSSPPASSFLFLHDEPPEDLSLEEISITNVQYRKIKQKKSPREQQLAIYKNNTS